MAIYVYVNYSHRKFGMRSYVMYSTRSNANFIFDLLGSVKLRALFVLIS